MHVRLLSYFLLYFPSSLKRIHYLSEYHLSSSKIAGRNINNLRYADDTALMAESEEELKRHLMRVKEKS